MHLVHFAICLSVAAACGGGADPGDDAPDADPGPADPQFGDPANVVSILEGRWWGQAPSVMASATFTVGATGWYTEAMRGGQCRLLTSDAEYCGECSGWCVGDTCQPFPTYRSAGRITTTGLSAAVSMSYESGYYAVSPWPLPAELFAAGDAISVTAAGAEVPGFTVAARGVATVEPDFTGECENEWHVTRGQEGVITWDAVAGSRIRVWIPSVNNGHGLPSRAVIECEGPDTGELRIPAAMIDAMPGFVETVGCDGLSCVGVDCPPSTFARYSQATTTAGDQDIVLRVASQVTFIPYED
jgi:hypothetical protein